MALIALDVGGTKIAGALFSKKGELIQRLVEAVSDQEGREIGQTIIDQISVLTKQAISRSESVDGIGVCVPGIYNPASGTVWAPNLPGWESYPLLEEIRIHTDISLPIRIDSDRSCYILGEVWKGNAQECKNAIFVAVGTGIGAGIMVDGRVLRGIGNSAGAIGWMALDRPHHPEYSKYGCFEYHASGEGLVRTAHNYLSASPEYEGALRKLKSTLTTRDIFKAWKKDDPVAVRVIRDAIEFWGMGVANLISIFNPEKIILGGGVFDAAAPLLDQIKEEAGRWAQPIGFGEVSIELAGLGSDAGLYGAAYSALSACNEESDV